VPAASLPLAAPAPAAALLPYTTLFRSPAGAGPLNVTVPVEGDPPVTLVGFSVSEERVGRACGSTVSEAVLVTPAYDAEMVTGVDAVTALVLTVNVALLAPAAIVTLADTLAAPLLLESSTCAPPVSAGPLSVTVPVEDCAPPVTLVGFSVSEERVGRACGSTVSEAVLVTIGSAAGRERVAGSGTS